MADDPFDVWPAWPPPPVMPRPPELLFEFLRGHDRFTCELRFLGEWGVEAMFLKNEELFVGHRFDTRTIAAQWAESIRAVIEKRRDALKHERRRSCYHLPRG
jgi:hypothetical protein